MDEARFMQHAEQVAEELVRKALDAGHVPSINQMHDEVIARAVIRTLCDTLVDNLTSSHNLQPLPKMR